jgi:hypothetical protein
MGSDDRRGGVEDKSLMMMKRGKRKEVGSRWLIFTLGRMKEVWGWMGCDGWMREREREHVVSDNRIRVAGLQ